MKDKHTSIDLADASNADTEQSKPGQHKVAEMESVVIRFAGDSGDGMQLTGTEFSKSVASGGYEFVTHPDYPAEIRAPLGTLYGVSAYQIKYSNNPVFTSGEALDVLVAMNPAALKVNLEELKTGRHAGHQHERLYQGKPGKGKIHFQSDGRWVAGDFPRDTD